MRLHQTFGKQSGHNRLWCTPKSVYPSLATGICARGSGVILLALGGALAGVLFARPSSAQAGTPYPQHGLTVQDILDLEVADDAAVNATSSLIAVVVQRARHAGEPLTKEGFYTGNIRGDVTVFSAASGSTLVRTQGRAEHAGYWQPTWSPGGSRLAMLSLRGDTLSVCVWDRDEDAIACLPGDRSLDYLTALAVAITPQGSNSVGSPFLWLSDTVLAVALLPPGYVDKFATASHALADSVTATWARAMRGSEASVSVLDTPRAPVSSEAFVEVCLWNVKQGTIRTVFHLPYFAQGFRDAVFSPDYRWAAVSADQYRAPSTHEMPFGFRNRTRKELGVVNLMRDTAVSWYPHHPYTRFMRWAQDGDHFGVLAKQSDEEDAVSGQRLLVADPVRHTIDSVIADATADSSLRWKRRLAPSVRMPGRPRTRESEGKQASLKPGDLLLAMAPKGEFSIVRRLTSEGTKVYQLPTDSGVPRLLLSLNAHLEYVARASRILITYTARDGSEQRGVVLLPPGYSTGERYPLITWVYPGDLYTDTLDGTWLRPLDDPFIVFLNPEILAGRGYAVLFPSMPLVPPGTTGDPYRHMLDGVDPAIDTLIARGIADSTRLGIMGQSYGGYAVNCIVSQSHRFRAAISSAGVADLTSFALQFYPPTRYSDLPAVELPWAEAGQGRMGSVPWRDPMRYIRNSPISYVDSVHAPILIVAGDNDFIDQAEEWFTALDRAGKRARLVRYWGEGHILLSPANIKHFWRETLRWFGTHLRSSAVSTPAAARAAHP